MGRLHAAVLFERAPLSDSLEGLERQVVGALQNSTRAVTSIHHIVRGLITFEAGRPLLQPLQVLASESAKLLVARFLAPWRHPRAAPSSHTTSPAAMSGIQVPPRSLRVDADAQDADGRAQPRRLFTEPSTASSDEPEPPGTPEATRVPLRAPLRVADGREPLFTGPSSTHEPEIPTTPRTRIRRQLPESWQSPGDWAPEHNINPNPVRRKVFGGLLILGVAVIGVVSVGGVPVPYACLPRTFLPAACA